MTLLSSEGFYEPSIRGCMIAHPIDHLFKVLSTGLSMDLIVRDLG